MSFEPQPTLAWQFENSNVDSIQNLGPTEISGTITYNPSGKYGSSMNIYSPTNAYSNAVLYGSISTYVSSVTGFTICCWLRPHLFYPGANSTFLGFAGQNGSFSSYFNILGNSTGNLNLYCQNPQITGTAFTSAASPTIAPGTWNHLAIVCSPGASYSVITCYLNSTSFGTLTTNTTALGSFTVTAVALNRNPLSTYSPGSAEYDDLRVYRQALTAAQVLALYVKQGTPVPTDGPRLAWQFESSNVESVQGLVPRAQVSPGPAQLQGLATLITNAPTVGGEALFLPGSSYMNAGTSSPVNFDINTSNLFVEFWIYFAVLPPAFTLLISVGTGLSDNNGKWFIAMGAANTNIRFVTRDANNTTEYTASGTDNLSAGSWYHIAAELDKSGATMRTFTNGILTSTFSVAGKTFANPTTTFLIGASFNLNIQPVYAYIRDLRIVKGGIVPTASFPLTLYPDPFAYTLPSYVSGSGTVVFTMLSQFVTYPAGKFNKCLRLNNGTSGLNSNIEYSSLTSTLNNFSIAAWVYPYSVNTARTNTFFEMKPLAVTGTQFQVSAATTGKSTVAVTTNGGSLTELNSVANLTLGKWTHHCLTFSNVGATTVGNVFASYYINGTLQASSNASTQASGLLSNLVMGSTTNASADTGLDDFRVYDRTLTSAEVSSVYLSFGDPAGPKTYAAGVSSNVTTDGDGFTTHTFTTPGTFTCLRSGVADVLVVGGGGAGGSGSPDANGGGGGGGGGVQYFPNYNIRAAGTYTVTVGTGGSSVAGPGTSGTSGDPSQFMEIVSFGGGGGGSVSSVGLPGGSGGGGGRNPSSTNAGGGGAYGQGNSGATSIANSAAQAGGGAGSGASGPLGGAGISYPAISTATYGAGGNAFGPTTPAVAAPSGGPATGNGGGGNGNGSAPFQSGAGGPGIVMIRYLTQGAPQGYETVYTGETTIGSFAGYNSPTANVQVFHGPTGPGATPYTWVKPTSGTFARIECVGGGGGGASYVNTLTSTAVVVFLSSLGTLQNGNTVTTSNMTSIGITFTGTIVSPGPGAPAHSISGTTPAYAVITTTGTGLSSTITRKPAGTILNASDNRSGTISGVYGRGNGGGGGGYAFGIIPLTELPATVAVSVGGGGAGGNASTSSGIGSPSSFTPTIPGYGAIVGAGAGPAPVSGPGPAGLGFGGVAPSNIVAGGPGAAGTTLVVAPGSYSAFGGGGGGNENAQAAPSLFAGSGGAGATNTSAVQDGEYPGGGGGGGIFVNVGGGRGAPGRVRIIVY